LSQFIISFISVFYLKILLYFVKYFKFYMIYFFIKVSAYKMGCLPIGSIAKVAVIVKNASSCFLHYGTDHISLLIQSLEYLPYIVLENIQIKSENIQIYFL